MGQQAGSDPEIFLPGKISTGSDEGCSVFYRDASSFLWRTDRMGRNTLLLLEDRQGRWQPPREVRFFADGSEAWSFSLAPGGEWIYFTSDKGAAGPDGGDLWRIRLESGEWKQPEHLGSGVNSGSTESRPTITRDGVLYFSRSSFETRSKADLYRAVSENGRFDTAAALPTPLNSDSDDYDPFIATDGSYLIFSSRRPGGSGQGDLYISFADERGSWTAPRNLGPSVNSPAEESRPSVTADGLYFFFASTRINEPRLPPGVPPARSMPGKGSRDIYWMKADFVRELRRRSVRE